MGNMRGQDSRASLGNRPREGKLPVHQAFASAMSPEMGSAGSVGAQAVGVGQGSGEVTLQLTPQWSLGMGVGGVFPEEGTACGEEGRERRAE